MKKILIIDDQKNNLTTIKAVIKSNIPDCKVLTALSGKDGLKIAKEEQPAIILLDVIMPQMDGYKVCKRLKEDESTKNIPVVMITAIKTDPESRVRGLNIGADAFLSKPIDSIELTAQVNVMLRIKEAEDKLRIEKELLEEKVKERTKAIQAANEKLKRDVVERKQAEEALHQYEHIVASSTDMLALLDNRFTYLAANKAYLEAFKLTSEQLIGSTVIQVIGEEVFNTVIKPNLDRCLAGEEVNYQDWFDFPGYGLRYMDITYYPYYNVDNKMLGFVMNGRNITKRKRAEQALSDSEYLLRKSQEIAAIGSYILDIPSGIWSSSHILDTIFGVDENYNKDVSGWLQIVHPEDQAMMQEYFRTNVLTNHESLNKEYRIKRINDQQERWVHGIGELEFNDDGNPIKMIGTIHDITERKKSEQEIIESKNTAESYLNIAAEIILTLDAQGNITLLNESGHKLLGYKNGTLIGKNWFVACLPKTIKAEVRAVFNKLIREELENVELYENTVLTQEGTEKIILWHNSILKDDQGRVIGTLSSGEDITERKQAEKQLNDELRLRMSLIDNIPDCIALILKKGTREIVASNKLAREVGAVPGQTCFNTCAERDDNCPFCLAPELWETDQSQRIEVEYRGTWLEVLWEPLTEDLYVHYIFNITKRKIAEKAHRESEERFREMANLLPQIVFETDINGILRFANKHASELTGYPLGAIKHELNVSQLLIPEDRARAKERIGQILAGKDSGSAEYTAMRKDGSTFPILVHSNAIIKNNKPAGLRGIIIDITAHKKVEKRLTNALKKATESDRLKSAFLATMSHELRTPLNAVIGFSQLLDKEASGEEVEEFANRIHKSGSHLLEIIEDIFDITLIETGEIKITKEEQTIHPLMEDLLVMMKSEQEKLNKPGIEIRLNPKNKNNDLHLLTDHLRLKQILIHLLSNALKFTEKGVIEFGYHEITQNKQHLLQFYVSDTGIGIPKEKQTFIFDVFRQVDDTHTRRQGGTGIGLSIAKKLTELLGGKIWLESDEGAGSTFYFTIPYAEVEKPREPIIDETKKRHNLTGKTVLIVEDVESSFEVLNLVLERSGIKTVWAKDGKEAIKLCKENSSIELVLMDINMPVMNGYEATKEIKKIRPKLPIIAQTAYALAGDREKFLAAGCDDYISKPIEKELFMEKLGRLLGN